MKTLSVAIVCVCFVSLTASCFEDGPTGTDAQANGDAGPNRDSGSNTMSAADSDDGSAGPNRDSGSSTMGAADSADTWGMPTDATADTPADTKQDDGAPDVKQPTCTIVEPNESPCSSDNATPTITPRACSTAPNFEPNDSQSAGCPIQLGTTIRSDLQGPGDPLDCYQFAAVAGSKYTVSFTNTTVANARIYVSAGMVGQTMPLLTEKMIGPYTSDVGLHLNAEIMPMATGIAALCVRTDAASATYSFNVSKPH